MSRMSKANRKKLCPGCRSNRYNQGVGYQETAQDAKVTCTECDNLAGSRVVNKMVYYSPGDVKPFLRAGTLSCWHNEMGYGTVV